MTLPDEAQRVLLRRYRGEIDQLVSAGGKVTSQAFRRIGSLDEAAIARFIDEAGPALRDVSARAGASASGVAAMLTDSPVGVPGVADPAWRDPFTSGWRALGNGAEFDDAFEQAASVADATGRNAVASTAREAVSVSAPAGTKWRRITDANPCDWCIMVAQREYNSASSANFGHDRCACMVVPAESAVNAPGAQTEEAVDRLVPQSPRVGNRSTGYVEHGTSFDPDLSATKAATVQRRWNLPDEDGAVRVRTGEGGLRGILDDGRFKTMHDFDGRVGGGASTKETRMAVERSMFGTNDTQPVYGYVNPRVFGATNGEDAVWQYGGVRVGLKSGVMDRTTVTFGDSLVAANPPAPIAIREVAKSAPSRLADAWADDFYTPAKLAKGERYVEAQIHGGLKVSDISFVEGNLPADLADRLVALGIKVVAP